MLKKIFLVVTLLTCTCLRGFAQDSLKVKADSVLKNIDRSAAIPDTSKKGISKLKAFGNTMAKVVGARDIEPDEKPRIVFIRSIIVPGTGQITNKQYWKVPIVYGAAGVSGYFIWFMNKRYNSYVDVLQDMKANNETQGYITDKNGNKIGPYSKEGITSGANQARRYRDLNIIGFAVGWVLFAVEANVAAHLKTFDMSEDISLKISPSLQSGPMNASLGLKFQFNIK